MNATSVAYGDVTTLDTGWRIWYNTHTQDNNTHERNKMIKIKNATVETLDDTQARPVGSTILTVSFGGHTFQMVADADEVKEALKIHNGGTMPCMTPAP